MNEPSTVYEIIYYFSRKRKLDYMERYDPSFIQNQYPKYIRTTITDSTETLRLYIPDLHFPKSSEELPDDGLSAPKTTSPLC